MTPLLAEARSVHAIDRRGREVSGDGDRYSVEREYEDVAAVMEAVSASSEEPVGWWVTRLEVCALSEQPL